MPDAGSELHALLIGIDRYSRDGRPALGRYPDLRGAVRDAERMECFLRERAVPEARIRKLTAPVDRREPARDSPSYENIMETFQKLRREARPGDRILIYFSGHGGRVATICPQAKGPEGIDEALVPVDVAEAPTRYVRDVELAFLLHRMVDEDGLLVTLVFDCCHAGGTTRKIWVRGSGRVDRSERRGASRIASPQELARTWQLVTGGRRRSLAPASGWLPEPRGYVLLAACRADELAFEGQFDASGRSGALTFWLLDSARRLGPNATCRQLHSRLVGRVREHFAGQTPQLEGDENRVFLGTGKRQTPPGVNVLRVDLDDDGVLLAAGEAHGVGRGERFALYPAPATDLKAGEGRIAVVEVLKPGAVESWAEITERFGSAPIEPGAQARLLAPGDAAGDDAAHLARYRRLRDLDNPDPNSHLRGRLRIGLYRLPAGFDPRMSLPATLLGIVDTCERLDGTSEVRVGEWLCLLLENASAQPLNVVVFDLEPGWGVSRICPAAGDSELLEPGARKTLPLAAELPAGWRAGCDVIKAFATVEATSFRWLEMPSLESSRPKTRSADRSEAGQDWTVAQVEVRLVRD